jgi:radical SAM superfamily enzyme YgiQ (UPF0313 family)
MEMLKKMKKAGCISISYGIESGSQKILDSSKKGITLAQSKKAIDMTKKAGIGTFAYFIIGLPGENWDTIRQTIRFAKRLDPDYVNFHIATPFPGTELYDIAVKNKWLVSDNWADFEEEGSAVLRTEDLSPKDLVKAQKMAMRSFYMQPKTILKQLLKIRNLNDIKVRIDTAIKLIR